MLMDEPFAAVDPVVRARLQDQFLDIQRRLRKTIVFVTHDIDEAIKMADRIAILNVGGIVEQYAPPEEILRVPASAFVADFVGRGARAEALGAHRGRATWRWIPVPRRRTRRSSATTRRCDRRSTCW